MRRLSAIIGLSLVAGTGMALADEAAGILPPFSHYAVILERKPFGDMAKPEAAAVPEPDQAAIEQAKEEQALSKYYMVDNGLRTATLIAQSDDAGRQLENAVFLHLYRSRGADGKVCYWQGRGECDFAVCRDNEVVRLVQATWSLADAATRRREVAGLLEAAKALDCGDLAIVTHDEEGEIAEGERTIRVVPAWKLLLG